MTMILARQMFSLTRLSIRRLAGTRFMIANLLLAALPVVLTLVIVVALRIQQPDPPSIEMARVEAAHYFQFILRTLYLHFVVFFIAIISGFAISRQDLEERTLHFILLQPIPRWAMVAARFVGYLGLSIALVLTSLWLSYLILIGGRFGLGGLIQDLFGTGGRLGGLLLESLVLVMALIAYGAIGMAGGSAFKTLVFAPLLWVWDGLLPFLPQALKELSLTHYFQSLLPERLIEQGRLLELLGEPAATTQSLFAIALVSVTAIILALAVFQTRECIYNEDAA